MTHSSHGLIRLLRYEPVFIFPRYFYIQYLKTCRKCRPQELTSLPFPSILASSVAVAWPTSPRLHTCYTAAAARGERLLAGGDKAVEGRAHGEGASPAPGPVGLEEAQGPPPHARAQAVQQPLGPRARDHDGRLHGGQASVVALPRQVSGWKRVGSAGGPAAVRLSFRRFFFLSLFALPWRVN